MRKFAELEINDIDGCFIAGGSILSLVTKTETNDIDVYPKHNEGLLNAISYIYENDGFLVNISDRALTFKINSIVNDKNERMIVQVMTYEDFESAEKIFEHFDFTVCMAAFDCDTQEFIYHDDFFRDVASKTLFFNEKTRYPLNSLLRTTKYRAKGYHISKPQLTKMALTIAKTGFPESWDELENQIGGTYGRELSLNKGELEYTFENILSVLDNIISFSMYEEEKVKDIDQSTLLYMYDRRDLYYIDVKDTKYNPNIMLVDADGNYQSSVTKREFETITEYKEVKPYDGVKVCYGYKLLREKDGELVPGIHKSSNGIRYRLGEFTEETNIPYLFVFPAIESLEKRGYIKIYDDGIVQTHIHGNDARLFKVMYLVSDIKAIQSNEIQVSKMMPVEEIKLGTK